MIFTQDLKEHCQIVNEVLKILWQNHLFLKPSKCEFEATTTKYLRLIVGGGSVPMDPVKVKGITEWPVPTNKKELQSFLGFLNFYRRFVEGFSTKAKPLTKLTGKMEWIWEKEQQDAFDLLHTTITTAPMLAIPTDDGEFCVEPDASGVGLGGILPQKQAELWKPIAFYSRTYSAAE
jgi:hypothetical protein